MYDNTVTPTPGPQPNGLWEFSRFSPYEEMGDDVQLAGTERVVTEFQLLLSSTQRVQLDGLRLSFWLNDGMAFDGSPDAPGTKLWKSEPPRRDVWVDGPTIVSFDVPYVSVPDRFTWTVSTDSMVAGMVTYDPPAVGQSQGIYWDLDINLQEWFHLDFGGQPPANFGAKILAVPEPASFCLMAVGSLIALFGKRRRSRPLGQDLITLAVCKHAAS